MLVKPRKGLAIGDAIQYPPNTKFMKEKIPRIEMHPVVSSNLKGAGYHKKRMILRLIFNNDAQYDYYGVEEKDYEGIFLSTSPGGYVKRHIIDKYNRYKKIK